MSIRIPLLLPLLAALAIAKPPFVFPSPDLDAFDCLDTDPDQCQQLFNATGEVDPELCQLASNPQMTPFCPQTCSLCDSLTNCTNILPAPTCDSLSGNCANDGFQLFMMLYCPSTCGFCE